ncbi:MAG: hypothetical protein ACR2HJ_01250, partial [Fimbriimonadales bacterium]
MLAKQVPQHAPDRVQGLVPNRANRKAEASTALATATVASNAQVVDFEDLLNNGTTGYTLYGSNVDSGGFNFAS